MNTIHFIHRFYPCKGGSENYLLNLALALLEHNHKVTVVTTNAESVQALWRPGEALLKKKYDNYQGINITRFPIFYFPYHTYFRKLLSFLPSILPPYIQNPNSPWIPKLVDFANTTDEPFDLVHCTAFHYDGILFPALALATRQNIPLICTPFIHLGELDNDKIVRHYSRPSQIDLLKKCKAVIVQTQLEFDFLVNYGIARERIFFLPQGLFQEDIKGGDADRFRSKYRCKKKIIAHIGGSLCEDKGTITLIEAFQKVAASNDCCLVLLGRMTVEFEHYFASLSTEVKRNIIHLQDIPDEERNDLLAAMDVLVHPSRTDSFGRVFLEAWAYKKPVIGAIAGGIPGVIEHNKNGILIKFGAVNSLANEIIFLLKDKNLGLFLGENGYRKLWREYNWLNIKKKLIELFEAIVRSAV